jgi:WD40 repeat protein
LPLEESEPILGLTFSHDGKRLLSLSDAGTACLWDVASGKAVVRRTLAMKHGAVAFAGGRALVLTARDDVRRLQVWDLAEGKETGPARDFGNQLSCLAFSPDGRILVTGSDDRALRFWSADSGKLLGRVATPERPCQLEFTADGTALIAGGGGKWWHVSLERGKADTSFKALASKPPQVKSPWYQTKPHRGRPLPWRFELIDECTLTPDGFMVDLERNAVRVWKTGSREKVCELQGNRFYAATLMPNRRALAVLRGDLRAGPVAAPPVQAAPRSSQGQNNAKVAALADLASGTEVDSWALPGDEMIPDQPWLLPRIAFAPGGRLLAAGTPQGSILFWDIATSRQFHKLGGPQVPVSQLAFAPDGSRLACAYRDATVLIWDVAGVVPPVASPGPMSLNQSWQQLASNEPALAWKAHWTLVAASAEAVSFLKQQVRPAVLADLRDLPQKIKDLDSPHFAVRQRAMKDLQRLALDAEPGLRAALKNSPSLETSRRIGQLLARLTTARTRQTQEIRAVAVLEQIASLASAKELLAALTRGAPGAPLTRAARDAQERLARSPMRVTATEPTQR